MKRANDTSPVPRPAPAHRQPARSLSPSGVDDDDSTKCDRDDGHDDGLVLSDVHLVPDPEPTSRDLRTTRFAILQADVGGGNRETEQETDGDGHGEVEVVIRHRMATPLEDVGFQVWRGALLMVDHLLHVRDGYLTPSSLAASATSPSAPVVLELGAGTGLASLSLLLTSPTPIHAIATDLPPLLSLLEENKRVNADSFNDGCVMDVKALDLTDDTHPLWAPDDALREGWDATTLRLFRDHCTLILAADLIYVDSVTLALVKRLWSLLRLTPPSEATSIAFRSRTLIVSLERRVQFTLGEQEARAPAWDFFIDTVEALNADREDREGCRIAVRKMAMENAPQRVFGYERVKELEGVTLAKFLAEESSANFHAMPLDASMRPCDGLDIGNAVVVIGRHRRHQLKAELFV
ncbi:Methyltransferase-like protein 22 [Irineochytrium annulatum]|nr:Methyltransferase-like protein 22 [Irineochytrium annulatum]